MRISRIVRQTPVKHGDEWTLLVSTIQTGFRAYETTVFDDTPDKRLEGWTLGGRTIETTVDKANTREEAMEQHREALYAARTGTPKAPQSLAEPRRHDWDETPAEAARYDRAWDSNDHDIHRDEDE